METLIRNFFSPFKILINQAPESMLPTAQLNYEYEQRMAIVYRPTNQPSPTPSLIRHK